MANRQSIEEKEWLKRVFNIQKVVVEVKPGETNEEAWIRHVAVHPEDSGTRLRVFNRQPNGAD
jgi:hypothetical protein